MLWILISSLLEYGTQDKPLIDACVVCTDSDRSIEKQKPQKVHFLNSFLDVIFSYKFCAQTIT